jgi:hypothetical protein
VAFLLFALVLLLWLPVGTMALHCGHRTIASSPHIIDLRAIKLLGVTNVNWRSSHDFCVFCFAV